jgi:cytoskeletal protein CcmA (bactofilin family)
MLEWAGSNPKPFYKSAQAMIFRSEQAKLLTPPVTAPVKPERAETPCVIGVGGTVTGKITSPGFVQIDGHVQGEVRANTLVINATAFIQGDVFADSVLVRGKITGNVRGRDVTLRATAHVEGTIFHKLLAVDTGATFEGESCPSENPMGDVSQLRNEKASAGSEAHVISPVLEHRLVQAAHTGI